MANQTKTTQSSRPYSGRYLALAIATLALIINFWAWSLLGPLGGRISTELALTPVNLALLLAVPVIIGSLGRIALGVLTDKFGGRAMFVVTCLLTMGAVVLLSLAHSFPELLSVAVLLGIGGASFVIGIPFVSAWFAPEKRGLILGIYSMGNAGTALSGFLTPRFDTSFGRQYTFLFVATLLLVMAIVFAVRGRNSPAWQPTKKSPVYLLGVAARSRTTWDLSIVYAITFGAFVAFGVYLPVLLKVAYNLSLTDAAARAAGFVLLATAARPIGGWLSDRIGGKTVVRMSLLVVVVLAASVAVESSLRLTTTAAYLSLAVALGFGNGAVFAMASRLSKPETMGSVTGIIGTCGGLGGFLPPLLLGFTYQRTHSYSFALALLAGTALIVLLYIHYRFRDDTYIWKRKTT